MATTSAPAMSSPACRPAGDQGAVAAARAHPEDAGVARVDALKIDIEGFEDRALIPFFKEAPQSLWPRAVVIEHLSREEWKQDCVADMLARGYVETGKTRSNTLLVRSSR